MVHGPWLKAQGSPGAAAGGRWVGEGGGGGQNTAPELLNLLFKHIFHKNGPKTAERIPIISPMISLGPVL